MSHIRIEQTGAVGTITIDRPDRFNSLDVETARDLRKAGLQCARDDSMRAVILAGAPGIFCSGVCIAPRVTTMFGWSCQQYSRRPSAGPSRNMMSIGP